MQDLLKSYIQWISRRSKKLAVTNDIAVQITCIDSNNVPTSIAMGRIYKVQDYLRFVCDNRPSILFEDTTIVGGFNEVEENQIQLSHVDKGNLILKFANRFHCEKAVGWFQEICGDITDDSGRSSSGSDGSGGLEDQ